MKPTMILASLLCVASIADAGGIFFRRQTYRPTYRAPVYHHSGVKYQPARAAYNDADQITINNYVGGQAARSDTVYGPVYDTQHVPLDPESIINLLSGHDERVQARSQASSEAIYGFSTAAIGRHAEAEKLYAAGAAISGALSAARSSEPEVVTFSLKKTTTGWEPVRAEPVAPTVDDAGAWGAVAEVKNSCIACHSGTAPKGGVDLSDPDSFSAAKWAKIHHVTVTKGTMPPDSTDFDLGPFAKLVRVPAVAAEISKLLKEPTR